jgi:N4-gp56 family major capsid protein
VINMPKNFGKTIKVFEYVPLLDDRNVNDQGIDASGATIANGNLYGSSRDIGTITGKLPTMTENGGRVNRVGFTRVQREGSIYKFGFFYEWTQESQDFDSDEDLADHLARELTNGAVQMTEAALQKDLLASASTIIYAGAAAANTDVTAEGATPSIVSYANFMRLDQTLTNVRCPKQTTVITGSRLVDTATIPAARIMFVGSELVPLLKTLKDPFNNQAFIPVQKYGDAGTILNGEIGAIDAFRIVLVPEMLNWAGAGANVGTNPGYRATSGKYNVYPMLVVGEDSFTTIGFQTDGKTVKFSVTTKAPGMATADRNDPYGEVGFSSIKWYYGFLCKRPERLGLIKTVAPL